MKKSFYKKWFKKWGDRAYLISKREDFCTTEISDAYKENPNKGSEIRVLAEIIQNMDFPDGGIVVTEFIWKKYRERFVQKYLLPRVKRDDGYFPRMNKTKAIHELILRGWVHEDEVKIKPGYVYLRCNIAPLAWPEIYFQHMDAISMLNKVGIPGYTGTVLPKSK